MDTGKTYYDEEGNECSIREMVRLYPDWAANRVQEGERAIASVERLRDQNAALVEVLRTKDSCARQCEGAAYRAEAKRLKAENAELLELVTVIEKRLREDTRPLVDLVNLVNRWKAVYSSCIRAQVMARTESAEGENND